MNRPITTAVRTWTIMGLLCLGVLIAYADRSSLSSALASESFTGHFELDADHRGWLGSAFFWSYALLQMPMGWVVDRYGVKWPYALCFGLWCLATAASGLVSSFFALFLMRFMVGATEAVVMPASYRWLRHHIAERHMGLAIGFFAMGNKIGTAIGAPLAAWLIVAYDWRTMFLATGICGLIWLLPWLGLVDSDLPQGEERKEAHKKASAISFGAIMASPVVWGGMIVNFCYSYFTFYCMTWMPSYLVETRGLSLETSGFYTFFSFIGIAIVAVLAGWSADRLIARGYDPVKTRKAFVVAGFLGASTVLMGVYAQSLEGALFWNMASLSFLGLASANNLALTKVTLIPPPAIGMVVGVQHVAAGLSGGTAASLSGWLLHVSGGYEWPMRVIVLFLVLGATACIILLRPQWAPKMRPLMQE
ncbi:MFS transporter [Novosphingobium umbonatum]|uniref:MFS transporter n=1 Tax=Novosphingobium umbonatum TaxID=1908524 RepID=A0A3S2X032_9SPHN|nr:MFS transporter [Novosphingobium umbonatum]RVU02265.1 MFS transporter [Novosphingobium umbonatum]